MKVWLLRHGATAYNMEGRYQGRRDIPLSAWGMEQLRRAEIAPPVVYVSPLLRAKQTAAILFPEAELVEVSDLREMDFGAFEGKTSRELAEDHTYRSWVEGGCTDKTPEGESRDEFSRRIRNAFSALMEQALSGGENTLVILAHAGTQMAALEHYGLPRRDYFDWCGPLAGGFMLETDRDRWRETHTLHLVQTVQYIKEPV